MGEAPPSPRRGVRRGVYVLPALFTAGNILCGYLSLDAAAQGAFEYAAKLVFLAAILDGLDGRVARLTGTTSAFGEQLDSLADVVSFGVAPAFLVYRWGLSGFGRAGLLVSFLFVVCGALRLARFNVQIHVVDKRWFVGLPIPSAA
ncbi:MAG TPA: CDP-diacylglycerol--serine O-phosphatidyltransferase, partial [Thermoanaerobaculia bacterium]|nr:CDP-diacylglycerol--serine O-phosphatidyltransferase [Thermoanaerobaculia bacterium]